MKFRNKKKFRYGIPTYTGPFRKLILLSTLVAKFSKHLISRVAGTIRSRVGRGLLLFQACRDTSV
jgi:hypothetical protein